MQDKGSSESQKDQVNGVTAATQQVDDEVKDANVSFEGGEDQLNYSSVKPGLRASQRFQNLSSGISSIASQKPDNKMMDAIVEAKKQEDQKKQIHNRIVRLRLEEQKANKKIKEMQQKHKFMVEMHQEKARRYEAKSEMQKQRQRKEDQDRQKFKEENQKLEQRKAQKQDEVWQSNQDAYNDIKSQQKQINQMVYQKQQSDLKDKQAQFQQARDKDSKAKHQWIQATNENTQNVKNSYEMRVKEKMDYANETDNQTKLLEQEEIMLINRLQKTQQNVQKMTELLNQTSDKSPVKQLQQEKKMVGKRGTSMMEPVPENQEDAQ